MQKLAENIQLQTITEDGIRTVYIQSPSIRFHKKRTDPMNWFRICSCVLVGNPWKRYASCSTVDAFSLFLCPLQRFAPMISSYSWQFFCRSMQYRMFVLYIDSIQQFLVFANIKPVFFCYIQPGIRGCYMKVAAFISDTSNREFPPPILKATKKPLPNTVFFHSLLIKT